MNVDSTGTPTESAFSSGPSEGPGVQECGNPNCPGILAGDEENLPKKLKMCARCLKLGYCSAECQKAHWKAHKPDCAAGSQNNAGNSDSPKDSGDAKISQRPFYSYEDNGLICLLEGTSVRFGVKSNTVNLEPSPKDKEVKSLLSQGKSLEFRVVDSKKILRDLPNKAELESLRAFVVKGLRKGYVSLGYGDGPPNIGYYLDFLKQLYSVVGERLSWGDEISEKQKDRINKFIRSKAGAGGFVRTMLAIDEALSQQQAPVNLDPKGKRQYYYEHIHPYFLLVQRISLGWMALQADSCSPGRPESVWHLTTGTDSFSMNQIATEIGVIPLLCQSKTTEEKNAGYEFFRQRWGDSSQRNAVLLHDGKNVFQSGIVVETGVLPSGEREVSFSRYLAKGQFGTCDIEILSVGKGKDRVKIVGIAQSAVEAFGFRQTKDKRTTFIPLPSTPLEQEVFRLNELDERILEIELERSGGSNALESKEASPNLLLDFIPESGNSETHVGPNASGTIDEAKRSSEESLNELIQQRDHFKNEILLRYEAQIREEQERVSQSVVDGSRDTKASDPSKKPNKNRKRKDKEKDKRDQKNNKAEDVAMNPSVGLKSPDAGDSKSGADLSSLTPKVEKNRERLEKMLERLQGNVRIKYEQSVRIFNQVLKLHPELRMSDLFVAGSHLSFHVGSHGATYVPSHGAQDKTQSGKKVLEFFRALMGLEG